MLTIKKSDIAESLLLELMSDMHVVKDKLAYYENKYHVSYEDFEQTLKTQEENYQQWDDYIEWKAYKHMIEDISYFSFHKDF